MYHHVAKSHLKIASDNTDLPSNTSQIIGASPDKADACSDEALHNNVTHLPVLPGQKLRQAREKKGISLHSVSTSLNISTHFLEAIEKDDYDSLPGIPYARGYMKNYCRFLQIPSADIISLFNDLVNDEIDAPIAPTDDRPIAKQWKLLNIQWHIYGLMCLLVLMCVLWFWPQTEETGYLGGITISSEDSSMLADQLPEEPSNNILLDDSSLSTTDNPVNSNAEAHSYNVQSAKSGANSQI
jgi:cytoskeletal protein RodZ